MHITGEHIGEAFDQIDTFARIHFSEPVQDRLQALEAFQEYLGVTEEASAVLLERVTGFVSADREEATRWLYIGVVLGLSAAAKASEPS